MPSELRFIGALFGALSLVAPRLAARLAFVAYSRPFGRARVRSSESDVHASATVEHLELADGTRVAAYRWGDGGEPVLLVHGWGGRASRYAPHVSALLAAGMSPIAFDSPGHGDSAGTVNTIEQDREIISLLHERYGRFRAVVAHSKGVLSAFYALRTGVTCDRVVAISGPARYDQLAERLAVLLHLRPRAARRLRELVAASFRPATDIWSRFSPVTAPPAVDAPILLLHDEDDDLVDFAESGLTLAAYAPNATRTASRGLGHSRILTDPETVRRVAEFAAAADVRAH
jgi:pimeloyl-ACP methyl ester carboxylesterase